VGQLGPEAWSEAPIAMPLFRLDRRLVFPPPALAEPEGVLAIGGDLAPERLLLAYANGIFPWYEPGGPILWWSPDPRLVLELDDLNVSRRLARTIRQGRFEVRFDADFPAVLAACAGTPRRHEPGTWITREMEAAYNRLFALGHAACAASWREGRLVGGIYGVRLGRAFFGESMFHRERDASKVALAAMVGRLKAEGVTLFDCQVATDHMLHMGAHEIPRAEFLARLDDALKDA
jgi:leucyl/phenylalanyl-tRNA--protein transferase